MKELIEALTILLKYGDVKYCFHCEHDELEVCGYDPTKFSKEDISELEKRGFIVQIEGEEKEGESIQESRIYSFRYGSA